MRTSLLLSLAVFGLLLPGCKKEAAQTDNQETETETVEVTLAPDFTLSNIDGEAFTLAEQRGNMVVMDFWATWCHPCTEAMPHMQQLHEDYKDRHVSVVGINVWEFDEDADPAGYVREHEYTYHHLLDGAEVATAFGLTNQIPVFFIIGFDGEILDERSGFTEEEIPEIRAILDEYLAERGL
ncbi:MAG: peroxiredoxin family protein [Phycisphaerales bacterium JB038]